MFDDTCLVSQLVQPNVDIDSLIEYEITPLVFAVNTPCKAVVELLVLNGANVNHVCDTGRTPLHTMLSAVSTEQAIELTNTRGTGPSPMINQVRILPYPKTCIILVFKYDTCVA